MSRHLLDITLGGRAVHVAIGWDRPMQEFFLQLWFEQAHGWDDAPNYSSLAEPRRDWKDFGAVIARLADFGITVPSSMLDAVRHEPQRHPGGHIVQHRIDDTSTILFEPRATPAQR